MRLSNASAIFWAILKVRLNFTGTALVLPNALSFFQAARWAAERKMMHWVFISIAFGTTLAIGNGACLLLCLGFGVGIWQSATQH